MKREALEKELELDLEGEAKQVGDRLKAVLVKHLRRRGAVVAISGGIDSSVSAALCVKALGPKKVFGLLLPETDSSPNSSSRGEMLARHLGIEFKQHNIASTLEAIGCYEARDEAIRRAIPEYADGWKNKIVIAGGSEGKINHFRIVVQSPDGQMQEKPLGVSEDLQIVAATNFKQRIRKTLEYYHADRLNYAVVGTPNRVEYDQGFFVKNGDGSADVKPIAHMYKSQVYAMARHLELPEEICSAIPTTDTYSLAQGQDEFYYALPYREMDLALWAYNKDLAASELAEALDISEERAQFVYKDIEAKRKTTSMLHWPGLRLAPVEGALSESPKPYG